MKFKLIVQAQKNDVPICIAYFKAACAKYGASNVRLLAVDGNNASLNEIDKDGLLVEDSEWEIRCAAMEGSSPSLEDVKKFVTSDMWFEL